MQKFVIDCKMNDLVKTSEKPKGGRRSRWRGSLSDFLDAWERYKAEKDANLFMYTKETSAKQGTTQKFAQRPYFLNEFARSLNYTRWENLKQGLKRAGFEEAFQQIEDEWGERLDFLAMTGAINPMYAARIRHLSDKQVVEHEGEVTTRTAERPCTAEEAAAHFASWSEKI